MTHHGQGVECDLERCADWLLVLVVSRLFHGGESSEHSKKRVRQCLGTNRQPPTLRWFESARESIYHMRKFEGLKMSEVRRYSLWKKGRLFACSAISTSLVAIMAVVQGLACIDNVPTAVLWLLVTTAGIAGIFS